MSQERCNVGNGDVVVFVYVAQTGSRAEVDELEVVEERPVRAVEVNTRRRLV